MTQPRTAHGQVRDGIYLLTAIEELNAPDTSAGLAGGIVAELGLYRASVVGMTLVTYLAGLWADSLDDGTTADDILGMARQHLELRLINMGTESDGPGLANDGPGGRGGAVFGTVPGSDGPTDMGPGQ